MFDIESDAKYLHSKLVKCNKHEFEYTFQRYNLGWGWVGECDECVQEKGKSSFDTLWDMFKIEEIWKVLGPLCDRRHNGCNFKNFMFTKTGLEPLGYSQPEIEQIKCVFSNIISFGQNFEQHKHDGIWMFWHGHPGTGKDHLAVALCKALLYRGYKAHLMSIDSLLNLYWVAIKGKHVYKGRFFNEKTILNIIDGLDLLILNELGLRTYNEHEITFLHQIISRIYDRNKGCLCVISNEAFTSADGTGRSVSGILGDRIMSRASQCSYWRLRFNWRDFRQMSRLVSVDAASCSRNESERNDPLPGPSV